MEFIDYYKLLEVNKTATMRGIRRVSVLLAPMIMMGCASTSVSVTDTPQKVAADVAKLPEVVDWTDANSTLFGAADPGGSVNFVTKKPRFEKFGLLLDDLLLFLLRVREHDVPLDRGFLLLDVRDVGIDVVDLLLVLLDLLCQDGLLLLVLLFPQVEHLLAFVYGFVRPFLELAVDRLHDERDDRPSHFCHHRCIVRSI